MLKVSTTTEFLSNASSEDFADVLTAYDDALEVKAMLKNKRSGESLKSLDKWYQEELGNAIRARSPPHMVLNELVRLMDWKLSRGKFRPRLIDLCKSNPESLVQSATEKGIKLAQTSKIEEAIVAVSELKGVGPATASAILAVSVPEKCCFFADEVAIAVMPNVKKIQYNKQEYLELNSELTNCAERLNKQQEGVQKENDNQWNPHKVELALWTHSILFHNNPTVLHVVSNKRTGEELPKKFRKKLKKN